MLGSDNFFPSPALFKYHLLRLSSPMQACFKDILASTWVFLAYYTGHFEGMKMITLVPDQIDICVNTQEDALIFYGQ